jgi:uncharacterized membrane protein YhaH (DUF805 family)
MTFEESIKTCFAKYAIFQGRASRSEYWWFALFIMLGSMAASIVDARLSGLFTLGTLLPSLAAATRRLHDTGRSGWWQLVVLVPVLGFLALIYFLCEDTQPEPAPLP